jgi:hypothetical protein
VDGGPLMKISTNADPEYGLAKALGQHLKDIKEQFRLGRDDFIGNDLDFTKECIKNLASLSKFDFSTYASGTWIPHMQHVVVTMQNCLACMAKEQLAENIKPLGQPFLETLHKIAEKKGVIGEMNFLLETWGAVEFGKPDSPLCDSFSKMAAFTEMLATNYKNIFRT